MSQETPDPVGRVDDDTEQETASSDAEGGAAASGDYDPAEGSPAGSHPVGEDYPDEAVRYDEPGEHPRSETAED